MHVVTFRSASKAEQEGAGRNSDLKGSYCPALCFECHVFFSLCCVCLLFSLAQSIGARRHERTWKLWLHSCGEAKSTEDGWRLAQAVDVCFGHRIDSNLHDADTWLLLRLVFERDSTSMPYRVAILLLAEWHFQFGFGSASSYWALPHEGNDALGEPSNASAGHARSRPGEAKWRSRVRPETRLGTRSY